MADVRKEQVEHDEATGKVASVSLDEVITDPESDLAVQVPPEADGSQGDARAVHEEPTPEEVFAAAADEAPDEDSDQPSTSDDE